MNKAELIAQVAAETGISKEAAERAVNATFRNIGAALRGGDAVRIVGFGNFQVAQRQARMGRNPRTGAEVRIPSARVPRFRAGKKLKEAVFGPRGSRGGPKAMGPRGTGGGPDD